MEEGASQNTSRQNNQKIRKLQVVLIVQARMGSSRLPGKSLMKVMDKPLLYYLVERIQRCKNVDKIVIATSENPKDQTIVDFCSTQNLNIFKGSEEDVLDRYYKAAKIYNADAVVRITGDCPLIDPAIIDYAIEFYLNRYPEFEHVSNVLSGTRTYPRGMDVEVFSYKSLEEAAFQSKTLDEREHVTPYIYNHPEKFKLASIIRAPDMSHIRWTVDTEEDFNLISLMLKTIYPTNPRFTIHDLLTEFTKHPEWAKINAHIKQKVF